ncbi:MAG: ABC transporter substrate-binding protein [Candidatus Micrarchaeota archaeon]
MNSKILLTIGIIAVIALGAFYISGSLTGFATANKMEKVKIADIPITQNIPLYLALENGYFEQEGIDVEVVRFDSPKQIVDAVVLNQVDLAGPGGATGISAIAETLSPGSLKYYAFTCHYGNSGNSLLIKKNSTMTSIKELEGKNIGKLPGIQWTTIVKRILKNNGVDAEKTQLVDLAVQVQLQALESGQIDALVGLDPIVQIGVEKGIAKILIPGLTEKYFVNPSCNGAGFVSIKFMQDRSETAEKVLKVMQRAINESNDPRSWPEQRKLLEKYLKVERQITEKMPFPMATFVYASELNKEQSQAIEQFWKIFYEDGIIKKQVKLEDVLLSNVS